jgi:hypothetical protein
MVTTVSTLLAHYDIQFAVLVLCNMALDRGDIDVRNSQSYPYDIRRTRLLFVTEKFVQSIALNVVNNQSLIDS